MNFIHFAHNLKKNSMSCVFRSAHWRWWQRRRRWCWWLGGGDWFSHCICSKDSQQNGSHPQLSLVQWNRRLQVDPVTILTHWLQFSGDRDFSSSPFMLLSLISFSFRLTSLTYISIVCIYIVCARTSQQTPHRQWNTPHRRSTTKTKC